MTAPANPPAAPVLHLISGLDPGGAPILLEQMLDGLAARGFSGRVVSLSDAGEVAGSIRRRGVETTALGMPRGVPDPRGLARLIALLRRERPALIQTWLYHADLLGAVAARAAGSPPVVWGVHHANLDPSLTKRSTVWTARACAAVSRLPRAIVCCSQASRRVHVDAGYYGGRVEVIPNGVDPNRFRPDPAARRALRAEWGLSDEAPLVALVARFHPFKDHRTFLRAASRITDRRPETRFILCGEGVEESNAELERWIAAAGVGRRVRRLGRRADPERIYAAVDVAVSSSATEALPLAVAEAMAAGAAVVSTAAGDCAELVGDAGWTTPIGDWAALADAIEQALALTPAARLRIGAAARNRIVSHYSLDAAAERYAALYRRALNPVPPTRAMTEAGWGAG